MNDVEIQFNKLSEDLISKVKSSMEESLASLHSEIMPYIVEDTEINAIYRAAEMIGKLASGNFEVDEETDSLTVKMDGYAIIRLSASGWDKARDMLASRVADKAKDLKIKSLERRLTNCYSNNY